MDLTDGYSKGAFQLSRDINVEHAIRVRRSVRRRTPDVSVKSDPEEEAISREREESVCSTTTRDGDGTFDSQGNPEFGETPNMTFV